MNGRSFFKGSIIILLGLILLAKTENEIQGYRQRGIPGTHPGRKKK